MERFKKKESIDKKILKEFEKLYENFEIIQKGLESYGVTFIQKNHSRIVREKIKETSSLFEMLQIEEIQDVFPVISDYLYENSLKLVELLDQNFKEKYKEKLNKEYRDYVLSRGKEEAEYELHHNFLARVKMLFLHNYLVEYKDFLRKD